MKNNPEIEKRIKYLQVRCTPEEKQLAVALAKKNKMTFSQWIRKRALTDAEN